MKVISKNEKHLAIRNHDLSKQWHITKNGDLTPNDVTAFSTKKVWWQCENGHEWEATVYNRSQGNNCPYCSGRQVDANNCLQAKNHELSNQWHPTRNGDLTPNDVTEFSNKKVWWQCENGHEWEAVISNRSYGRGCPFCSNQRICDDNSLQTLNSTLAKQWHPTKNGNLNPNHVTAGSNKKIWWLCEKGHEWEAIIGNRAKGIGCPICSRSSQTSFPEQAIYFYLKNVYSDTLNRYKYNNKWEIDVFVPSLNFGIEYDGVYYHQHKKKSDSRKKLQILSTDIYFIKVVEIDGDTIEPHIKNNIIYCNRRPTEIQLNQVIKLCFKYIDDVILHQSVSINIDIDVKKDRAKIYDLYIELEEKESLLIKHPELSKQWHPSKNLRIMPNMIKANSGKKVWWLCEKGHEWEATVNDRTSGRNCPFCSGKRACIDNSLQTLNPELAKQWHPTENGNLTPNDVTTGSQKKVWWLCEKGHKWDETIKNRSKNGCPFCSGRRVCAENSLQTLNPNLAEQWHTVKNEDLTPNDVVAGSHKKVWWKCEKGHEWEATIKSRNEGRGCPFCSGRRKSV